MTTVAAPYWIPIENIHRYQIGKIRRGNRQNYYQSPRSTQRISTRKQSSKCKKLSKSAATMARSVW